MRNITALFLILLFIPGQFISAQSISPAFQLISSKIPGIPDSVKVIFSKKSSTGLVGGLVPGLFNPVSFSAGRGDYMCSGISFTMACEYIRKSIIVDDAIKPGIPNDLTGVSGKFSGIISIGSIFYQYERVEYSALSSSYSLFSSEWANSVLLVRDTLLLISPMQSHTYYGDDVLFKLDDDFVFSNLDNSNLLLRIDFNDDGGWRSMNRDAMVNIHYSTTGLKDIQCMSLTNEGDTFYTNFRFQVKALQTPDPHDTLHIVADISYLGGYGSGDAYVYYAPGHNSIVNPVIVIEGFDIDNTLGWEDLYWLLQQENMLDSLGNLGYDAIILNFDNSLTYMQRQAFLVMSLIDSVNALTGYSKEIAMVGASMGGLIGRYALSYMETHSMDHRLRNFITFDTPHDGANIPLGMQYMLSFAAGLNIEPLLQAMLDQLNQPAARQMLVYHHLSTAGNVPAPDPLFTQFQSEMIGVGDQPVNLRKVAISNGSGLAQNQGYNAGAQLIYYHHTEGLFNSTEIIADMWALPDGNYQKIFEGKAKMFFITLGQQTDYVSGSKPYDNCPGGYRTTIKDMADIDPAGYGDIIALHDNHCFIPYVSSLDLDTSNLFYNASTDAGIYNRVPFDTVYFPNVNEEHVHISPQSANWFIDEIHDPNPAIRGEVVYAEHDTIPLPGVGVNLADTAGAVLASLMTRRNGFFRFGGLSNGDYELDADNLPPWGGGNSSDALLILQDYVQIAPLSGIHKIAADVDNSGSVNSIDALMVAQRFVQLINTFPAGDWVKPVTSVSVSGNIVDTKVRVLCTGDVNASYRP